MQCWVWWSNCHIHLRRHCTFECAMLRCFKSTEARLMIITLFKRFFPSIRIDPPPLPLLSYSNDFPPHSSIPNITRRKKATPVNVVIIRIFVIPPPSQTPREQLAIALPIPKKGVCVEREKRKTNKQQRAHRNAKWKEEVSSPLLAQMRLENAQWICTVRCKMQSRMGEQP